MADSPRDVSISPRTQSPHNLSVTANGTKPPRASSPLAKNASLQNLPAIARPKLTHSRHASDAGASFHSESGARSPLSRATTPPGRRSVQFARPSVNTTQPVPVRTDSDDIEVDEAGTPRSTKNNLLTKLKALAASTTLVAHGRSQSTWTIGAASNDGDPDVLSPASERESDLRYDTEANDADAESSGEENTPEAAVRRRKMRRLNTEIDMRRTAPSTPAANSGFLDFPEGADSPTTGPVLRPLKRRVTMTDLPESSHGASDDHRVTRAEKGKRPAPWASLEPKERTPDAKRGSSFRRITGFGNSGDTEGSPSPGPWHISSLSGFGERSQSISAAKWRQLKANIKAIGSKKKEENKQDHKKSAELLAELTAGVPAAIIFASMFQVDEHGKKRIPVLLEQLKVRITDSKALDEKSGSKRHLALRIELEYGNGLTRMTWVINREVSDFVKLHTRYKFAEASNKFRGDKDSDKKLPHFPRSAVPFMKGSTASKALDSDDEAEPDIIPEEETGPSAAEMSGAERPVSKREEKKRRRSSFGIRGRVSSLIDLQGEGSQAMSPSGEQIDKKTQKRDAFAENQRAKLERYLQQLVQQMIFRPDSTRLCKFLELSALGIRLGAEGSYHGKEGYLVIKSAKGLDFRSGWAPNLVLGRHSPKWFLVRHSYIVCVDSPEEMNIYDVFLVDSMFQMDAKGGARVPGAKPLAENAKNAKTRPQYHRLKLINAERKVKLLAKNEKQLYQFRDSIQHMIEMTVWSKPNRFDSFAPIRKNVACQWLVDGRDYMWNVSRAIEMAKDVIYIHDWWLSPEIYMRRPAAISQKYRLDRMLQRKASEGVKVFVIVYRNVGQTIPIDSSYTKYSLLDLHPNIFVQRSPNQFRQQTFFWAHHEKICIIDHSIGFVGGIDLCFGRWDTPQHILCDDKPTGFQISEKPPDPNNSQLWVGKDYSNPRTSDFFELDKPYEDMYDREVTARMPWHDISMQVVGQVARDLTRHFVQRWNYILRQRKPSRPTPFLLPPPDFAPGELEALDLEGTCEVQILRSSAPWSMGFQDRVEHSILNAYLKTIEQSEHLVYIENQFFISSSEVEGIKIENAIADALVERIIRAHNNDQDWRAIILIPLVPGFESTVAVQDGSSVRLIMQCQYRTIARGEKSIFGRLRAAGIEPEDYITFYSLRSWGKIGPQQQLVTEQVYIHAKCMIVDDRVAIIGSANINERSMLGSRDSEVAAIVRDTDMLWSTLAGEPYLVGKFPHSLRMRLMREHLGLDVDEIMAEERQAEIERELLRQQRQDADSAFSESSADSMRPRNGGMDNLYSFNHDIDWEQQSNPNILSNKRTTKDKRVQDNKEHFKDVAGEGRDLFAKVKETVLHRSRDPAVIGNTEAVVNTGHDHVKPFPKTKARENRLAKKKSNQSADSVTSGEGYAGLPPPLPRMTTSQAGLPLLSQLPPLPVTNDSDIGGPSNIGATVLSRNSRGGFNLISADMVFPKVDKDCMRDPLNDSAYHDTWHRIAENNTKIFRHVFRCMPDNEVKSWPEYKEYVKYADRFAEAQGGKGREEKDMQSKSGPPGAGAIKETIGPIVDHINAVTELPVEVGDAVRRKVTEVLPIDSEKSQNEKRSAIEAKEEKVAGANDRLPKTEAEKDKNEKRKDAADTAPTELNEKQPLNESPPSTASTSEGTATTTNQPKKSVETTSEAHALPKSTPSTRRRRRTGTRGSRLAFSGSDPLPDFKDAEELLHLVQGDLVMWPYDWLENEEHDSHWLWPIDRLAPLEI